MDEGIGVSLHSDVAQCSVEELQALRKAARQLHSCFSVELVLRALVTAAVNVGRAERSWLLLWEDQRKEDDFPPLGRLNPLSRTCSAAHTTLFQPSSVAWESTSFSSLLVSIPIEEMDGHIIGILCVEYRASALSAQKKLWFFHELVKEAALALRNARLFEEVRRTAQQEARQRLMWDLHDFVVPPLHTLMLVAEAARRAAPPENGAVEHHLSQVIEMAQGVFQQVRRILYQQPPCELEARNFVEAVRQRLDAFERESGVKTRFVVSGELHLPSQVENELFCILHEALNNIFNHAEATAVTVNLCAEGTRFALQVRDNGRGFRLREQRFPTGLGLRIMQRRAERIGGVFNISSRPGQGTEVKVTLDVPCYGRNGERGYSHSGR